MTPREMLGYLTLARRRESHKAARDLQLMAIANRSDPKHIEKIQSELLEQ